jgi:hypothetical protein
MVFTNDVRLDLVEVDGLTVVERLEVEDAGIATGGLIVEDIIGFVELEGAGAVDVGDTAAFEETGTEVLSTTGVVITEGAFEEAVANIEELITTTGASGVPSTTAHAKLIFVCKGPLALGALRSQAISTYGQHTFPVPTLAISPETNTFVLVTALPTFFPLLSTS